MKAPKKQPWGKRFRFEGPDREWLEHQYLTLGKSASQIAKMVGCSETTAQQWVRDAGWRKPVPVSSDPLAPMKIGQGIRARFTGVRKKWLDQEYIEKRKSSSQIAEAIGTSHFAVCRWLKQNGIPARNREETGEIHSERMTGEGNPAWNGGTASNYQRGALERSDRAKVCEWCGATEKLEVHHHDHDRSNGDLVNLGWFCRYCNMVEAHLWHLEQKGRIEMEWKGNELRINFWR